jgi:acyl-coenzyme A synthetase/AMP-(fatty) acid ligase
MDRKGRIWFCGRKSHRVTTAAGPLYTIPCESIFNTHPLVYRSALVGIGPPNHQIPAVCIELKKTKRRINRKTVRTELLHLAAQHEITREIKIILFRDSFPVDIRHNAKIFREQLADWAARRVKPAVLRRDRGAGDRR